eukprot:5315647-Karenia_brevis.AAC.1
MIQQWATWSKKQKRTTVHDTKLLLACVEAMDADEREFFRLERELAEVATLRRSEHSRQAWKNYTPNALKVFVPDCTVATSRFVD